MKRIALTAALAAVACWPAISFFHSRASGFVQSGINLGCFSINYALGSPFRAEQFPESIIPSAARNLFFALPWKDIASAMFNGFVQKDQKPAYEVYAIRYAVLPDFPVAGLVKGADRSRKMDLAMTVWLVKGNGRVVLVDSGFYRDQFFKVWKVNDFVRPSEALAPLGVRPEEVTDVIITHMHWDHADGMDLFPKARIWVQKDEYAYYTGEAWQQPRTHGGIDPDDVLTIVKLNTQGRVTLVNGDGQEIIPGIICYTGGKHTWQSQYVGVESRAGKIILASDNMYLYENLAKHTPIAATLDADSNLRAQNRMKQLAADPKLIVPGHDPAVLERFSKISERIVRID